MLDDKKSFNQILQVFSDTLRLMADNKNKMQRLSDYLYRTKAATAIKNIATPAKHQMFEAQKPYNPYSRQNHK
jgi:paraquat-inducible protein B